MSARANLATKTQDSKSNNRISKTNNTAPSRFQSAFSPIDQHHVAPKIHRQSGSAEDAWFRRYPSKAKDWETK